MRILTGAETRSPVAAVLTLVLLSVALAFSGVGSADNGNSAQAEYFTFQTFSDKRSFITFDGEDDSIIIAPLDNDNRQQNAVFNFTEGLAGSCSSFESAAYPGYYLRHQNYTLKIHQFDGTQLFRDDATFCAEPGTGEYGYRFQSLNFPGHFIVADGGTLFISNLGGATPNSELVSRAYFLAQQASVEPTAPAQQSSAPEIVQLDLTNATSVTLDIFHYHQDGRMETLAPIPAGARNSISVAPNTALAFSYRYRVQDQYQVSGARQQRHVITTPEQRATGSYKEGGPQATTPQEPAREATVPTTPREEEGPRFVYSVPGLYSKGPNHVHYTPGKNYAEQVEERWQTHFSGSNIEITNPIVPGQSIAIRFEPDVYAWKEDGATYIRIDTNNSRISITGAQTGGWDKGYFPENIKTVFHAPKEYEVAEYYPTSKMGSTSVSQSRGYNAGGNLDPFSIGLNAAYNSDTTVSKSIDHYEVAVEEPVGTNQLVFTWRLCGIGAPDDDSTECNYNNEPWNLGRKTAGQVEKLYELPPMATQFDALRHSIAYRTRINTSRIVTVPITVEVDMERVWLESQIDESQSDADQVLQAIPRGLSFFGNRDTFKGELLYRLRSLDHKVRFKFDIEIDLYNLALVNNNINLQAGR